MGLGDSSLADQLFDAVNEELEGEDRHLANKITGMLLELDQSTIKETLTSQTLLRSAVEKTKTCLKHSRYNMEDDLCDFDLDNTTNCDLGDLLYEKVQKHNPNLAKRITGITCMLEMDQDSLKQVLCSETVFERALDKAIVAIKNTDTERQCTMLSQYKTGSKTEFVEYMGDLVYENVEKLYPSDAPQITGMLLELDENTIKDLLNSEDKFQDAVKRAADVIERKS